MRAIRLSADGPTWMSSAADTSSFEISENYYVLHFVDRRVRDPQPNVDGGTADDPAQCGRQRFTCFILFEPCDLLDALQVRVWGIKILTMHNWYTVRFLRDKCSRFRWLEPKTISHQCLCTRMVRRYPHRPYLSEVNHWDNYRGLPKAHTPDFFVGKR